ncbi:flagellar hook-length control protein FliK [Gorillibacterium sp. sgz500922]|uniref:flagellar hook-length control protein FliK n=1 Tax=Gorillibacterium sp. sgz500922 TaxID=3446694 RepID=UPI003F66381E
MDIGIANPIVAAASAPPDAGKTGKTAVPAGSAGAAGTAAASKKPAFQDILDRVNAHGDSKPLTDSADSASPEDAQASAALSEALIALLQSQSDQAESAEGDGLLKLIETALAHSEERSKLLESDEGQSWLAQAAQLLGAMGYLNANAAIVPAVLQPENASPSGLSASQTQQTAAQTADPVTVLAGLLAAMKQEPDGVLVSQLGEGFAKLLSAETKESASSPDASTPASPQAGTGAKTEDLLPVQVETRTVKPRHSASALEAMNFRKGLSAEQLKALADAAETPSPETAQAAANAQPALTEESAGIAAPLPSAKGDAGEPSPAASPYTAAEPPKGSASTTPAVKPEVPVNLRNFADDVSAFMLKSAKPGSLGTLTEARLLLRPEHLGAVDVRITLQNGQLVAHFAAQQSAAKDALENQMALLRQSLQSQGYQVDKLEVTHSPSLQSGMFQGEQGRQPSRESDQRSRGGERRNRSAEEEEFTVSIPKTDPLRGGIAGATVDVTA